MLLYDRFSLYFFVCLFVVCCSFSYNSFGNLDQALTESDTQLRLFGKPQVNGQRRMGVALGRADTIADARNKANQVVSAITISL